MQKEPAGDIVIVPGSTVTEQGDAVFYEISDSVRENTGDTWRQVSGTGGVYEAQAPTADPAGETSGTGRRATSDHRPQADVLAADTGAARGKDRHVRRGMESLVWLAVFTAGLIAGTLLVNFSAVVRNDVSGDWMADITEKAMDYSGNVETLVRIFIKRAGFFVFLAGITLLWRRSLILYLSTAYFGFCFGVVIASAAVSAGPAGLVVLLKLLLPHYLLYIPAFIGLLRWSGRYLRPGGGSGGGAYAPALVLVLLCAASGCVLECYVNPIWIKFFSNI